MARPKLIIDAIEWHRIFAWWPVRLEDGQTGWLQMVERRLVLIPDLDPGLRFLFGPGYWQYRLPCPHPRRRS